jgi:chemotaxis protein methyltransferase CheR
VAASQGEREFAFSTGDFEQVRQLLYAHCGISLNDGKQPLVYSRLARRLRALNIASFAKYLAYLRQTPDEMQAFTNALTTNLTAFFRERHHFEMLAEFVQRAPRRPLRIWSAASSTGEEPYSIAITVADALGERGWRDVSILASDVDTGVLDTARAGIYPLSRLEQVPLDIKRRWFRRGKGPNTGLARVRPELQQLFEFRQINLLDRDWSIREPFDVIFCRNVMIYFDKPTQRKLIERMLDVLHPDGLFFAGHSESFFHLGDLIAPVGRTVYRHGSRGAQRRPA